MYRFFFHLLLLTAFTISLTAENDASTEKLLEFLRRYHLSSYKNDKGGSPLGFAALIGDASSAKLLLLKKADPNELDKTASSTPFSLAIEKGDTALVSDMLIFKANPNQLIDHIYDTCMPRAINDPNAPAKCSKDRYSVLEIALKEKHLEIAKKLIESGADIHYQSELGYRPIHIAVRKADLGAVKYLLEKGADANVKDSWGYAPLHYAAFINEDKKGKEIAELLIEYGADVNSQVDAPVAKFTPLHLGAMNGRVDLVQTLLKNSSDVKIQDAFGCTPLWSAVNSQYERRDIIKALLLAGANPNEVSPIKKNDGQDLIYLDSPLTLSTRKNKLETLSILLENRADPNLIDGNGNTALLVAVDEQNLQAASLLLKNGSNPSLKAKNKISPIEKASLENNLPLFDLLIKAEANQILN